MGSLALVKQGQTPSSPVDCPTSVNVNGKVFTNDSFYPPSANGRITLATALANSCNTAFINERTKLGDHDLVDAAATLGMGVDHDLGFPAYFGNVVPPASETEKAADMIGQGQILASPMTMATVMASVVAGHTVVPQLVTSVNPATTSPTPLTGAQDATLKQMLRGVVTGGTGIGLHDVPGPPVIAKTGTAEFDRGGKRLTHAWMIAGQGDLAVCAFVDVGQTGAGTAGPLLEQFLRGALAALGDAGGTASLQSQRGSLRRFQALQRPSAGIAGDRRSRRPARLSARGWRSSGRRPRASARSGRRSG